MSLETIEGGGLGVSGADAVAVARLVLIRHRAHASPGHTEHYEVRRRYQNQHRAKERPL